MKRLLHILIAASLLGACSSPSKGGGETPGQNQQTEYSVTVTPSTFTFMADGDTVYPRINCTEGEGWTLTGSAAWCTLSATSGKSGDTLTIDVAPNNSPDERSVTYVVTCGTAQASISIVQKQRDSIIAASTQMELDYIGGYVEIPLQYNVSSYTCTIEQGREWLTHVSTRAMATATEVFKADANSGREPRVAIVTFKYGSSAVETVTITQKEDPNWSSPDGGNEEVTPGNPIE